MRIFTLSTAAMMTLIIAGYTSAGEYTVTGAHNCCGACSKAIKETLAGVEGVTNVVAEAKSTEIKFEAADAKIGRQAINKLGFAGFHGDVTLDGKRLKVRDNSKVEAGKLKDLTLVGLHNCCPGCKKAIEASIAKVEGIESKKYAKNGKSVTLTGEFDGQAVVKALNADGFHVRKKGSGAKDKKKEEKKDE